MNEREYSESIALLMGSGVDWYLETYKPKNIESAEKALKILLRQAFAYGRLTELEQQIEARDA